MSQLAVFCEWMSKPCRTVGNSNSYYKPSCVKIVQIIHGWKIWLDCYVTVHARLTTSILQWFCFFSNAYILFTAHVFTVSPMKATFLWFLVLLWINASRHTVVKILTLTVLQFCMQQRFLGHRWCTGLNFLLVDHQGGNPEVASSRTLTTLETII